MNQQHMIAPFASLSRDRVQYPGILDDNDKIPDFEDDDDDDDDEWENEDGDCVLHNLAS